MTSIINLFKTELTEDKNAKVDDLQDYLNTCDSMAIDDFQRVKNDLDLIIKIDLNQKRENDLEYNYLSVLNYDEARTYYYFIKQAKWTSQNTLALHLKMDTLNTFLDDLDFDEDTHITRRHKDRFVKKQVNHTGNETLYRIVDKVDEGIQANLYKIGSQDIKANIPSMYQNLKWYLIYKTKDELTPTNINNPVECYMCADIDLPFTNGSVIGELSASMLEEGEKYFIIDNDFPTGSVNGGVAIGSNYSGSLVRGYYIEKVNGTLQLSYIVRPSTSTDYANATNVIFTQNTFTFNNISKVINTSMDRSKNPNTQRFEWYYQSAINSSISLNGLKVYSIDEIDRTDSRIMKIIELPYCPSNITFTNNLVNIPAGWSYDNGRFKLLNLNEDFVNSNFVSLPLNTMKRQLGNGGSVVNILLSLPKDELNESKLFNSNFYIDKISYDSFSKLIKYENINKTITTDQSATIQFKMSNNIASKFAFKLSYNKDNYSDLEDYEDYMIVQRNNELVLFNNNYIDYIRNGYNFDIKAKNQAQTSAVVSSTLGIAGAIASLIGGAVSGGVGIPLAIGTTTSVIGNIANSINTQISTERNIQQKLQELESQATSVTNADDLNLLNYYNNNKLKRFVYKTNDEMTSLLFNLFYYGGYKCDEYAIPKHNTRVWFDFVQCEANFENGDNQIYSKYIDDIKQKFLAGVTYYHHQTIYGGVYYDFEQKKENWESWIIE